MGFGRCLRTVSPTRAACLGLCTEGCGQGGCLARASCCDGGMGQEPSRYRPGVVSREKDRGRRISAGEVLSPEERSPTGAPPVPHSFPADGITSGSSDGSSPSRGDGGEGGESHCSEGDAAFGSSLLPNSHPSFHAASHGDTDAPFPTHLQPPPAWGSPKSPIPGMQQLWESALLRSWGNITAVSPVAPAPSVPAGRWGLGSSAGTQLIRSFQ